MFEAPTFNFEYLFNVRFEGGQTRSEVWIIQYYRVLSLQNLIHIPPEIVEENFVKSSMSSKT